ncbi:MAG TPA: polymer-forming cytoskeletal protein [Ktedonobacterales bacterium]|jgi:cytoskeletal protein CcmA (bactofilin family)
MRRHRYALLGGGAVLLLLVCCLLVVVISAVVRYGHLCGVGNSSGARTTVVQQGQTTDSVMACGGSVLIAGHVTDDVSSYGGSVMIAPTGQVDGDISSYGGRVEIAGRVSGDVDSYGGTVHISRGGLVSGDVTAYGDRVIADPGAQVQGDVHERAGGGFPGSLFDPFNVFPLRVSFWTVLLWGIVAVALVHWLPERTRRVGEVIFSRLPRSVVVGTLSWVLGVVLAFILAFTIIGIPVSVAIVAVLIAGAAMGEVALSWVLGRALLQRFSQREHSRIVEVLAGVALLALLGAIPFFGAIFNLALAVVGVGATFLSRFGARRWTTGALRRWAN